MSAHSASAATLNVDFTKLSGSIVTGQPTDTDPTVTGIFRADLSSLNDITSILIADRNDGIGLAGQYSGFDLDAIKISTTLITDASQINTATALNVFDFSPANTVFTPGTQRAPTDPALFGTTGGDINNAVATLGTFDSRLLETAPGSGIFTDGSGFVSLGDGGQVLFNLASALPSDTPVYLYVAESGNNEFLAQASVTFADEPTPDPVSVPEPTSLAALSLMGIYFAARRKQAVKTA
ncbi:PEP-CTERM sorting domain-containing protein [Nodularia sphaerocarpa]|uniref:PEP-CTERM sorting domain-containing protein n=1 Tax=Nodularia sphaerocarpa TaxID=137816 RepID=UPI001EFB23CA|nr:PEP-CTERM sorting domain-containing protein [Nodularia sphaerocarpa]MDB9373488.1 PEP-CTERM sorting domain-containing protein [Nodularia sphaerocarpa CS-585]MDB9377598.1 PEP-CTERM sorting domain-containing protein [Nodularia sphaerocarpa CS-585A2]